MITVCMVFEHWFACAKKLQAQRHNASQCLLLRRARYRVQIRILFGRSVFKLTPLAMFVSRHFYSYTGTVLFLLQIVRSLWLSFLGLYYATFRKSCDIVSFACLF